MKSQRLSWPPTREPGPGAAAVLRRAPLLWRCTDEQLETVRAASRCALLAPGERLIAPEGAEASYCIVAGGLVLVSDRGGAEVVLGPPDTSDVIDLIALTPATVLVVSQLVVGRVAS